MPEFGGIPAALIFLFWWIRRWDWRDRQLRRPYLHRLAETGSSGRGLLLPSIVARGLASTRADPRAAAITSAAGLGDEPKEDCTLPLEGPSIGRPEDYDAPYATSWLDHLMPIRIVWALLP